ncbi:hypothetical protein HPB51_005199 [Rhipicephalus microplus]|uniref:HTH CENPB-type domain-containing protein n=1 Tax=Rhipicephalus microplus TaxID=6941 RepID=A0A9J6E709_RHIMP|nr:hypothetical protein HPB51_005199 [Rhipicephalus microplus]
MMKELETSRCAYCPPRTADQVDWQGNITEGNWRADDTSSAALPSLPKTGCHATRFAYEMRDLLAKHFITNGKVPWQESKTMDTRLYSVVGQGETIMKNVNVNAKQAKTAQHVKLEETLLTWFKEVTAVGVNIDGKVLREKADEFALALHIDEFQVSGGWLQRFKTRHALVYKSVCGEAKKAGEAVVSNWRMAYKNRKILLFLDQCAAHPRQVTLQNVKLFFLPANATTHLQPLDAGIVRNVKHHFKSLLVRRLLAKIDRKDEDDPRISLLDAIHFIAVAWNRVTPTTIANCFGKCGFFGSPEEVPPEPEDPTIEDWEQRNVECTSDDFCTADDNLATCGARTVEDIVEEATCEAADSSDDGDDIDVGDDEGRASAAETLHALDVLRRAVAADEVSDDTCTRFYAFEQSLLGDLAKKKRQKDIRDFFIKK